MLENIQDKKGERDVQIEFNAIETPMHEINQEDINYLMADGYEV